VAPPVNPHPMTTRVKREFRLSVNKLTLSATSSSSLSPMPTSVRATLVDPSWRRAMEEEYDALTANNTWDLVPHPVGYNVITDKWIFNHKFNSDGTLEWYKAHWVLHGFTQRPASTTMRLSARLSSQSPSTRCFSLSSHISVPSTSLM
jgi:hypothetical protein